MARSCNIFCIHCRTTWSRVEQDTPGRLREPWRTGSIACSSYTSRTSTQTGKPGEYPEVSDFFDELCKELDLEPDRLFVVPGNHDIDRNTQKSAWECVRMRL